MNISQEEIKHLAALARLKLTGSEEEKLQGELAAILGYVAKLDEVNTKKTEITAQVSGLTNITRPDYVEAWSPEEIQAALSQGEVENNQVKVKRVL